MTKKHKKGNDADNTAPQKRKRQTLGTVESPMTPLVNDPGMPTTPNTHPNGLKVDPDSPTPKRPKPSSHAPAVDSLFNHIILIQVGPSLRHFGLHEGLLRNSSPIFSTALTSSDTDTSPHPSINLVRAEDGHISHILLADEDANIFTRVNRYLYTSSLLLENEELTSLTWAILISVYLFAIKFQIIRLQNKAIDDTIRKFNADHRVPNAENIGRLWRPDPGAAPLRQLFLQLYARKCDLMQAMGMPGRFHGDFMKGLVQLMYQMRAEGDGEKEVNFWKKRREWYVNDVTNPVVLDDP